MLRPLWPLGFGPSWRPALQVVQSPPPRIPVTSPSSFCHAESACLQPAHGAPGPKDGFWVTGHISAHNFLPDFDLCAHMHIV